MKKERVGGVNKINLGTPREWYEKDCSAVVYEDGRGGLLGGRERKLIFRLAERVIELEKYCTMESNYRCALVRVVERKVPGAAALLDLLPDKFSYEELNTLLPLVFKKTKQK